MSSADWPIVREVAIVFGYIMRGIFVGLSSLGIYSVPLCVIIFVVVSKLLLIPSTYKKQKYALLYPKVCSENQSLFSKFNKKLDHLLAKNKKNVEANKLLARYDISSSNSIAMIFIQLPVLFALYAIVNDINRFVPELSTLSESQLQMSSNLFGASIYDIPGFRMSPAIIFPILTALTSLLEIFQTALFNKAVNNGKLVGGISNAFIIAMMFWFSAEMPVLCSVYWITRSVVDIAISFIIKLYIHFKDTDSFAQKRLKKLNHDRKRRGLSPLLNPI